jgi:single-stranded-DNA-specific exonuclease
MRWIFPQTADSDVCARLLAGTGVSSWVAELLARRGMADPDAVVRLLQPKLRSLSDPFLLPGMDGAVTRILAALERGERIALYGDYDVDGVTSITILTRVLSAYGIRPAAFLPHRVDEGYGLTAEGIGRCVETHAPQLLIAVDCGTTSVAEIAVLRQQGVDTIVLDHHEPKAELPSAVAIVNPKLGPNFHYLCSAGLAFKLAHALLKRRPLAGFDLKEVLDLAAIGTVADIVPLVEENRILVKAGLERMEQTKWPGIRALIETAALRRPYTATDIAFGIGPRLNAAGRLASAEAALELLLTEDDGRARLLAKLLDQQNRERRALEDDVLAQAEAQILGRYDPQSDAAIVVGATGWHPGVVGIVAARLQRRHHRPVVAVGFDTLGLGKGSARSIEGLSLVAALEECKDHLERFGGHEMAAGLTMRYEAFPLFQTAFAQAARGMLTSDQLVPRLHLDAELKLGEINLPLLDEHGALQPFGIGHRQPVFFARKVVFAAQPRLMKDKHYSFFLRQGRSEIRAVWWNSAEIPLPDLPWDIAFTIERNEWNGTVSPQLDIRDVRTAVP